MFFKNPLQNAGKQVKSMLCGLMIERFKAFKSKKKTERLVTISHKWNFYLFDFCSKFFQRSVPVYGVRNISAKGVAEHSFSVVLPDAIFFTQGGKGVAAVVRCVFRVAGYSQPFQCRVEEFISMIFLSIHEELSLRFHF